MSNASEQGPASPLTRYDFSPLALRILRTAVATAQARESEIFTETLYFAFFAVAFDSRAYRDRETALISFLLAGLDGTEGAGRRYDEQRKRYATGGPLPRTQDPRPFSPDEPSQGLSANAAQILESAAELAYAGPGQIAAHHLLAAMIAPGVGAKPFARRRFEELGLDLPAFRRHLIGLVAGEYPKDDLAAWHQLLGVPTSDADKPSQRVEPEKSKTATKDQGFRVRNPGAERPTHDSVAPELRNPEQSASDPSDKSQADTGPSAAQSAAAENADPADDPLIDLLLTRRLAVSTIGSKDVSGAVELIDGRGSWGLGPALERGDFLLIYFPKTLTTNKTLIELGDQQPGLRFLLWATADSTPGGPDDNFNQIIPLAEPLELANPLDPSTFADPPLADWSLAKNHFRNAGRQNEPLAPDLARALWTEILATNPEIRPTLERWVADPAQPPDQAEVSTHATSDLWTVDDKLGYAEYARAIFHFLDDPRTEPPLTISIQAPWGGGKTSLMRMVQQQIDPKGYALTSGGERPTAAATAAAVARGLWSELRRAATRVFGRPAPQSLARERPTTRNVISELDRSAAHTAATINLEDGKCASIWFNAWRYQSSDQTWAGLAEAIIRGITDRMEPVDRERFLLRLHLSRINADRIRAKVYDAAFRRFVEILRRVGLWVLGGLVIGGGLLALWSPLAAGVSAPAIALFGAAAAYWNAWIKTQDEPAKLNLSDYVDVPDYSEKLGFVHHVTQDLRQVFALLPKIDHDGEQHPAPLAIFIDDLDRCAPQKVAEVFEAINLFVAGEFPNCYIVIGMDTDVVAAALEQAHKDVIQRLPAYARRVPVGWRFMDKFVQLPFVIPPLDDQAVENYAQYLAAAEDSGAREAQALAEGESARMVEGEISSMLDRGTAEDEIVERAKKQFVPEGSSAESTAASEGERLARQRLDAIKRQRFIDERARDLHNDSEKIRTLLFQAKENFSNNPRELKRLVNVFRFYSNLRLARIARDQPVPTEAQLLNWLMLALAWPEVVRWLRRSYSEWETDVERDSDTRTGVGHRLSKLEDFAVAPVTEKKPDNIPVTRDPTGDDWAKRLRDEFGLPDGVPWLDDERLFSYVRDIAFGDPDQRLSTGAGRGFW